MIPKLQNVMANFIRASTVIFEENQQFCISFKINQANFNLYSRKLNHDFRVTVKNEPFEYALGINLP